MPTSTIIMLVICCIVAAVFLFAIVSLPIIDGRKRRRGEAKAGQEDSYMKFLKDHSNK